MLVLHQVSDGFFELLSIQVLSVGGFDALEDSSTVGEKVSNDMRILDPRVFGLNVEDAASMPDVVVESEKRRLSLAHNNYSALSIGQGLIEKYHTFG